MKYPFGQVRNNLYHYRALLTRIYYCKLFGMAIGENTRIAWTARLDKTNPRGVKIGKNCQISFFASIITHDFVNNKHLETSVGDNCFIGAFSIIMPGVSVGDSCIIGAGSVVTADIPSNTIAVGNPARVIKENIKTLEYGIIVK
jgi:acetyltransferase-like isoleucine patch superfamily enzyme